MSPEINGKVEMMKRMLLVWMVCVGLAVSFGVPQQVQAMPITGSVGFIGKFAPVDSGGDAVPLDLATGIDFQSATAILSSGGLADSIIPFQTSATFTDFQFLPLAPQPVDPLWAAGSFEFVLNAITVEEQNQSFLSLAGVGVMRSTDPNSGLDETAYNWQFYGSGYNWNLSFSKALPEPGTFSSMFVLGLGTLSLSFRTRRRRGKRV